MRFWSLALAITGFGLAAAPSQGVEASPVPWRLEVKPAEGGRNPAGRLEVNTSRGRQVYWYVVYTVKNLHSDPVKLHLNVRLSSDASELLFHEGFYPHALAKVREKHGDALAATKLAGLELGPGESKKAVAIFQMFEANAEGEASRTFEEGADQLLVRFGGVHDPVKKNGLEASVENHETWFHLEKRGDKFFPQLESVEVVRIEDRVLR